MIGLSVARRTILAGAMALTLNPRAALGAQRQLAWGVDYGANTSPPVARAFELLVLEPDHDRPIAPLRGPMAQLPGYISLGEVDRTRPFVGTLDKAGALKGTNPNWPAARSADLRHPAWRAMVLDQLIPGILAKGFDGIFIDTLDSAEAIERADKDVNSGMVQAGIALLADIRARFPGIVVMLNRAYAPLPAAAPHIDYLLGEAMSSKWNFAAKRYELTTQEDWDWQASHLRAARQANPALVLTTLDYWDPRDHPAVAGLYQRERASGFNPYVATIALDQLLPEPKA